MGRRKRKPKLVEEVTIIDMADKGKSVGRDTEGRVVFVEKVVPGDVVDVLVLRKRKGQMYGVPKTFHKYSEERIDAFCEHFGICGGCKWQNLSYVSQLKYKENKVINALKRIGKVDVESFLPILGAEETTYYRNKMEFSFSNKKWLTSEEIKTDASKYENVLGFHPAGAYDKIVNINHCYLQGEPSNQLRNGLKKIALDQGLTFYDSKEHKGFLRQMMLRITTLGQVMLVVVVSNNDKEKRENFLKEILHQFPQITSLFYCINSKLNDFINDLEMIHYNGTKIIEEKMKDLLFKIGPKSFFQTNTKQAVNLYDVVVDFAELNGSENVYDLYTGIGSIALYIAKHCKQVVGIEEIDLAIEDAKINAESNKIENCLFYVGDVKDILTQDFAEKHGKADIIITDPPRPGMHKKVIDILLELEAPKIIYVSCNPATQARDLKLLSEKYKVLKARAVDMFPLTHHIESVALLALK